MSKELSNFRHEPVLLDACLSALLISPASTYVDCTAGGGGHSAAILKQLDSSGLLISFDRDTDALEAAKLALETVIKQCGSRNYLLIHAGFAELAKKLEEKGIGRVSGVLADLGVSSWQLDEASRGFAYMKDGPLDMRMDQTQVQTAASLINHISEAKLADILTRYGEERYAKRIAGRIVERRREKTFTSTGDLSDVIRRSLPAKARQEDQHPAKRSFQAIRIAVNDEFGQLESMLEQAVGLLQEGGRLAIISFHSLEDRIVKEAYRKWENPCTCPRNVPHCVCGKKPLGKAVQRKGIIADEEELLRNPRSRSARLRVFERNANPYQDYRSK